MGDWEQGRAVCVRRQRVSLQNKPEDIGEVMESTDPQFESVLNRVREQLNKEKIKLWLAPFTTEDGNAGKYPQVFQSDQLVV